MPVNIKSLNGMNALAKLGVDADLLAWLDKVSAEVKLTATMFDFSVAMTGGPAVATVKVTLDQLQALSSGTISPAAKTALKTECATAIKHLQAHVAMLTPGVEAAKTLDALPPLSPVAVDPKFATDAQIAAVLKKIGQGAKPVAPAQQPKQKWEVWPKASMMTAPPVLLRDATHLYQPVKGTSSGSRYFLVGATADLKVGVRIHGNAMSIRIEGKHLSAHVSTLSELGFASVLAQKNYASLHLEVGSKLNAQKSLGAILFGLGAPLETPTPDLSIIGAA